MIYQQFRKFKAQKFDQVMDKFGDKSPEYIEKQLKHLFKYKKYGDF